MTKILVDGITGISFARLEPSCRELGVAILDAVQQVTLKIVPSFDSKSFETQAIGWINVSGKGAFNAQPVADDAWPARTSHAQLCA